MGASLRAFDFHRIFSLWCSLPMFAKSDHRWGATSGAHCCSSLTFSLVMLVKLRVSLIDILGFVVSLAWQHVVLELTSATCQWVRLLYFEVDIWQPNATLTTIYLLAQNLNKLKGTTSLTPEIKCNMRKIKLCWWKWAYTNDIFILTFTLNLSW